MDGGDRSDKHDQQRVEGLGHTHVVSVGEQNSTDLKRVHLLQASRLLVNQDTLMRK